MCVDANAVAAPVSVPLGTLPPPLLRLTLWSGRRSPLCGLVRRPGHGTTLVSVLKPGSPSGHATRVGSRPRETRSLSKCRQCDKGVTAVTYVNVRPLTFYAVT